MCSFSTIGHLTAPTAVVCVHAGIHSVCCARRARKNLSLAEDAAEVRAREAAAAAEGSDGKSIKVDVLIPLETDADNGVLVGIKPSDWKTQDHYALLGLSSLRWKATRPQIRECFKKQVLLHHPDKKSTANSTELDREANDGYFTCIKKANEILSDPLKRRLFDSIDEEDDDIPSLDKEMGDSFFPVYGPVFAHNAKYFSKQPAPLLGGPDSPKEEVDAFYDFWYSTPCWREFGYYDAHTQKDNETRDERRWAEKQNKAERKKKQKEEKQRMIKLVDNAVACDPRIKAFKATEKRKKAALEEQKRKEKEAQQNSKREAERAAKAAEEQAEEEKVQSEKDAAEAGRRARAKFTKLCKKYGVFEGSAAAAAGGEGEVLMTRAEMEALRSKLKVDELQALCADTQSFVPALKAVLAKQAEKAAKVAKAKAPWTQSEQQLLEALLKSVPKSHPERWVKIAAGIPGRTKKACMLRVKELVALQKAAKAKAPAQFTALELSVLHRAATKIFPPGVNSVAGVNRFGQIAEHLQDKCKTAWRRTDQEVIMQVNPGKDIASTMARKKAEGARKGL